MSNFGALLVFALAMAAAPAHAIDLRACVARMLGTVTSAFAPKPAAPVAIEPIPTLPAPAHTAPSASIVGGGLYEGTYRVPHSPGQVQGFSFEKESLSPVMTQLWRPAYFPEAEWLALSDANRMLTLKEAIRAKERVLPTSLAPMKYGKLEIDGMGPLEVKHESFETTLAAVRARVMSLAHELNQRDSFHIHQSFSVQRDAEKRFLTWYKLRSDLLVAIGLDEGLLPNSLASISPPPATIRLPRDDSWQFKFLTLGLRGGIYGSDPREDFIKIGLEYRDVTRDLNKLFDLVAENARQIENEVWAREGFPGPAELQRYRIFTFSSGPEDLSTLRASSLLKDVMRHLPMPLLPLVDFTLYQYYDVATGTARPASAEELERLNTAKAKFLSDLSKLDAEIHAANKNDLEGEVITEAFRMVYADWARAARISTLFRAL